MKGRRLAAGLVLVLAACGVPERLAQVGKVPELRPIENPTDRPDWRPVRLPMPQPEPLEAAGANSLWRSGARAFFRDQRARRVGDIVTVQITIADRAQLRNETVRRRANEDDLGLANLFGLEQRLVRLLPGSPDPASLLEVSSGLAQRGIGDIERAEQVQLEIAAVVVQELPNGNLVIQGRQEVRVNYEVREIVLAGIVRPEDITPDNRIKHDKIAELRVGYGGRGLLSDVQQPRWGAQVLDILLPY